MKYTEFQLYEHLANLTLERDIDDLLYGICAILLYCYKNSDIYNKSLLLGIQSDVAFNKLGSLFTDIGIRKIIFDRDVYDIFTKKSSCDNHDDVTIYLKPILLLNSLDELKDKLYNLYNNLIDDYTESNDKCFFDFQMYCKSCLHIKFRIQKSKLKEVNIHTLNYFVRYSIVSIDDITFCKDVKLIGIKERDFIWLNLCTYKDLKGFPELYQSLKKHVLCFYIESGAEFNYYIFDTLKTLNRDCIIELKWGGDLYNYMFREFNLNVNLSMSANTRDIACTYVILRLQTNYPLKFTDEQVKRLKKVANVELVDTILEKEF